MVTKAEFLFMIQSVNLPASAHTITSSAHCNPLQPAANHPVHIHCTHCSSHYIFSAHCSHAQPCTAICSHPFVHTAAILSSAHCSYTILCTLQLYHPEHTAATLSGANTTQCIQCTSGPPQGKPISLLAYLQSSQQILIQWLIVAVHKMKKTG